MNRRVAFSYIKVTTDILTLSLLWSPFSYHLTLSQSFDLLLPTEFSVSVADFQVRTTAFSLVFLKFCDYYVKMSSCYFKPFSLAVVIEKQINNTKM